LKLRFFELFDPMSCALLDDLFERVSRMELQSCDIDRNRCRKHDAISKTFDPEICENRLFFPCDIRKSDQVVFS